MSTDIFGLNILSICLKRVLKFSTMIMDFSILLFYSIFFFSSFHAVLLGAYTFITVISSAWVAPFIFTKYPSLSLVIFFFLKSVLFILKYTF